MDIEQLMAYAVQQKSSDLHLSSGMPPLMRIHGELQTMDLPPLSADCITTLLHDLLNENQKIHLSENLEIDFSFTTSNLARVRINVFYQSRGIAAVFRIIPDIIPTIEDLNLPPVIEEMTQCPNGLVLVTGPTGSGKSTTLAAIINQINSSRPLHVLTIEDPIEFVHVSKKSLITQREVHHHTLSFHSALRAALREDPDVIMLGELRDLETIRLALTAAETGHLVIATLHTSSAVKAISRIIDVFPAEEKSMVRSQLSESLQLVIAQKLVRTINPGRVAVVEILRCTSAIRNLIREDKLPQIYSAMQTGQVYGMQTLEQHLMKLVAEKTISIQNALEVTVNKGLLEKVNAKTF
ncbi:MAG: type IV pilus twitching motility protein PilT [Legionella sp.]|nr:type IV pilus twitching motility protein PilT [Legionella sp.]